MDRITASPNYFALCCSDFCGLLPRNGGLSGHAECIKHFELGFCNNCVIFKAFQRLKEYEDTGLSPEDIRKLTTPSISSSPTEEDWEKFWREE